MFRDDVEFSSRPSKNVASEGIIFKDILGQTLGKYFKTLSDNNKLSVADEKQRTISIKLNLFESTALVSSFISVIFVSDFLRCSQNPAESEDSDEDSNTKPLTSKRKKKQKSILNSKKVHSSSDAESVSLYHFHFLFPLLLTYVLCG